MYYRTFAFVIITSMESSTNDIDLILKEIGSRVRAQRKLKANNYETFAKQHHFNKVTISRIEAGENFTIVSLVQVLRALDMPLEDLFKGIK